MDVKCVTKTVLVLDQYSVLAYTLGLGTGIKSVEKNLDQCIPSELSN